MKLKLTCGRSAVIALLVVSGWNTADAGDGTRKSQARAAVREQESFDGFVEELAAKWMRADPIGASAQQYFTGAEQAALDRQLTAKDFSYGIPLGPARRSEYVQNVRQALDQLKSYPRAQLTPTERASAASLEWQLRDALRVAGLEERRFVFEQFGGLHVSLVNFLTQAHPMRTPRDVDSYLARLAQLAPVLDEGIGEARSRARQGVIPPKFILQATIDGLNRLLAAQPEDNVLVASLAERDAKIAAMTEAQRAAAKESATKLARESIIPALGRVRGLLIEQLPLSTDDAGIHDLADGSSPYGVFLQNHRVSGTDKSRWTTATALLRFAATVNPLAEMPPQNDPWLGGREGRDLRVDG
jgi:uncharacterized protein (DUF885 family)